MSILRCAVLLGLAFLTACATQVVVNSDYAKGTDFSQYKTYRWHDADNSNLSTDEFLSSEFVDGRLHANVDTVLLSKGYLYRQQGAVDLLVSYKINSEMRQRLSGYGGSPWWGIGLSDRHNHVGYGFDLHGSTRVSSEYFQHASVVLDFISAEDHSLVWRGKAEQRMPAEQSSEEWRNNLQRVVSELLKDFYDQKE